MPSFGFSIRNMATSNKMGSQPVIGKTEQQASGNEEKNSLLQNYGFNTKSLKQILEEFPFEFGRETEAGLAFNRFCLGG